MSSFMSEYQHLNIPLEYIKKATNNFGDGNFLAEGGFGKVYRAEFFHSNGPLKAAVKRLTPSNNHGDADFWREITLLSEYKHENIILLLGFCFENKERILVYEYAPNKSLDNHLGDPKFPWIQRLKICLGAARGLEYLHNPRGGQQRVLHRDIKSANILLDENWNAKIADFGFSKYGPANQKHSMLISEPKGTLGYCDPVFLDTTFYTKESDVYSFGVVLLEVMCSRLCVVYSYNDMRRSLPVFVKNSSKAQIRDAIVDVNLMQQMDHNSFDAFLTIALQCLEREQKQRPPMDFIIKKLESAIEYQEISNALASNVNVASSSTSDVEQVPRFQYLDDYVKTWSSGNELRLGPLLSRLQDILDPEDGWSRVSLTGELEPRNLWPAYEKFLLLTDPDELIKKGEESKEKMYQYAKVRKLLKGAWEIAVCDGSK